MKLNIPFEKTITFETDIKEITSISLEHEITKNEDELLGNFIFDGTYKENELSINETPFNFIVPFTVNFPNPVDTNSIQFTIDNFTYDVINNELHLKVDYIVEYENKIIEESREVVTKNEAIKINNDINEENNLEVNNIVDSSILDDDYITYHIHVIEEGQTIETIAEKYNINQSILLKLNKNIELLKGNKIIIPIDNE